MIGQIGLETGESQSDQSVSSAVIRYLSPGGLQQSQDLSQSPGGGGGGGGAGGGAGEQWEGGGEGSGIFQCTFAPIRGPQRVSASEPLKKSTPILQFSALNGDGIISQSSNCHEN